jgi:hypothetical protein
MKLQLHPRVAINDPAQTLRVWAGAFGVTAAPGLTWTLNQQPAQPNLSRPMTSARSGDLLPDANEPRAFTGVFEFTGLAPGVAHDITASADGETAFLRAAPLPEALPTGLGDYFNVLLVSCFHSEEDKTANVDRIVSRLKSTFQPHLTILAGDQVYLDLPTLMNFPDRIDWLAHKFEEDYIRNWTLPSAYATMLGAAPSVAIPDDHEYWNNFPHASPVIQNSFTQGGRDRWTAAAQACYTAFQTTPPAGLGMPIQFDVPPLSFFLADSRTNKEPNRSRTLDENTHAQLTAWVQRVSATNLFPVFVCGQSLFRAKAGLGGNVTDFEMPNYGDYDRLMRQLAEFSDAGRPLLCLTGDVHWGRVSSAIDVSKFQLSMLEIISSPTSLVTSVGLDQLHQVGGAIGGLFGHPNPWPRHSEAMAPPSSLAAEALPGRFLCTERHRQKGDHLVLLRFRQAGGAVELRITYYPLHRDDRFNQPVELHPITLEPF